MTAARPDLTAGARTNGADIDPLGIQVTWVDANEVEHEVPHETVQRLRELVGRPPEDLEQRAPLVTRPGRDLGLGRVVVSCEDGAQREVDGRLPDDFPLGYHRLRGEGGHDRLLVVSPGRCFVPDRQRWGWTVQLYAARSAASWSIGDLGDLRTLREWTQQSGGGFLLVNPLHAVAPSTPQEPSPYLPATRRFRNPLYLRVEEVDGFSRDDVDVEAVRRLAAEPLVNRDEAWRLKRHVLQASYGRSTAGGQAEVFATWRRDRGPGLDAFATWSALVEEHGPDWHDWPTELQRPDSEAVSAFRAAHEDEVGFHAWLQWQLDTQLRAAGAGMTVIQDLPIGVSGAGADAWTWQDVLSQGASVGAPPDTLNTLGQDWGAPPMVPWRLRLADYEPFISSVRSTIAGAGGLRIDHVMGLFRLWWIPEGGTAADGAYVGYPSDDLLDIVALESHRAGAVVVGEDLGTVEPRVAEALGERGILSYKVLWFEDEDPQHWPAESLAAVTTHDLATVAGLWTGRDAQDQLDWTDMPREDVDRGREELLAKLAGPGLERDATVAEAVLAAYSRLVRAPSLLLSLSLEDAVLEERRPNVPGTVERDNWSIPLRYPVDALSSVPEVEALLRVVSETS